MAIHGRPVTQFQYNRQNRTVKAIAPDSSSVVTLSDHLGRTIQESFWSADQNENVILSRHRYDADGLVTWSLDKSGNVTTYDYDRLQHITTITAPNLDGTRTDRQTFDPAGNMIEFKVGTDKADTRTESYVYDGFGRQVRFTDTRGYSTSNTFDNYGRLSEFKDRVDRVSKYYYDYQSRQYSEDWFTTASSTSTVNNITTEYFPAGNVHFVTSNGGGYQSTITNTYDFAARVGSSESSASNRATVNYGYQYDVNRNRTQMSLSMGTTSVMTLGYTIDGLGRVVAKTQSATTLPGASSSTGSTAKSVKFDYLIDGRLDQISRYASATTTGATTLVTKFGYNALNLVNNIQHKSSTSSTTPYFTQSLVWADFNLEETTRTLGSSSYRTSYESYDDLQIKSEQTLQGTNSIHSRAYNWDDFGNPRDLASNTQGLRFTASVRMTDCCAMRTMITSTTTMDR